ncbi:FtsX-like permease family protein [Emticicia sp. BO119]|uniref:FtsX-like permease family protein n=1 Tax=Emticicia sp. BO119 TaxID=2757768 RepID=UPI001C6A739A|nr:FtsX-like permease family protein [Emticicia sp. BO119]
MKNSPPKWANNLLSRFHPEDTLEEVEGDLEEMYAFWLQKSGKFRADLRYGFSVLTVLPPFVRRRKKREYYETSNLAITMFRNYFKIAFRTLLKDRLNSSLTILGLALGLACVLLILLHVKDELSYDKGFTSADRIYRINMENIGETNRRWTATSPVLAIEMQKEIPAIQTIARFNRPYPDRVFSYKASSTSDVKQFEEKRGFYADSTVTEVFDLPFIKGNPKTALAQMNAIVLTEDMANKYFGNEDPIGKFLQDDLDKRPLTVTGVIENFAFPTHLAFDYLISMSTVYVPENQQRLSNRTWSGFYNFVVLNKNVTRLSAEAKLPAFMIKYYEANGEKREEILKSRKMYLQPITDIHLHSHFEKEMSANSDILYVYIFSVVAVLILLVASVNFINMATAQAFNRMKEVGVRKVLGARKLELIKQFLGESTLMTLIAAVIALLIFVLVLPSYNDLTGKTLSFQTLFTPDSMLTMLGIIVFISLVAGMYPAWFISNFEPIKSLKGKKMVGSSVIFVRKGLIVFQFVVSVFMIFSTIVVYQQMKFFQTKKLGFEQEQVVAVKLYGDLRDKVSTIKNELLRNTSITQVGLTSSLPGDRIGMDRVSLEGAPEEDIQMRLVFGDENLLPSLKIDLKSGRNFLPKAEGAAPAFIINEAAVKALKIKNPIGEKMVFWDKPGAIVGITKDFHYASLHDAIEPLVIVNIPQETTYLLIKIKGDNLTETIQEAKNTVAGVSPNSLFSYSFLDEKMMHLYDSEQRISNIMKVFAVFAIFISCLGLFGLSAYVARLRTKEIGIRKTLGASISGVVILLSKDFLWLVVIATVVAFPLGWWVMTQWLEEFAYAIDIQWWMFAAAGLSSIIIAILTVSFQSIKAALLNPIKSLKIE